MLVMVFDGAARSIIVRVVAIAIGIVALEMPLLQHPLEFIGKTPPAFAHAHVREQILFRVERHPSGRATSFASASRVRSPGIFI